METNHKPDGIWIPFELLEARLDGVTMQVFLLIHSFTQNGKECYVSNEYLMERTGCTLSKIKSCLAKLKEMGWIEQTRFDGRRRYLASTLRWSIGFRQSEGGKFNHQPVENPTGSRLESQPHTISNSTISKETIISDSFYKESGQPSDFDHETIFPETEPTPLNSKKEKPNQGGGRLHQEMVEAWDQHLQERFHTSVSGLAKLGKVGSNMKALQRIREFLHDHATKSGHSDPEAATLADFKLILKHKHNAGQFFDRADLTHLAKFLPDIIRGIQPKNQNQNNPYKIISDEQLEQNLREYFASRNSG